MSRVSAGGVTGNLEFAVATVVCVLNKEWLWLCDLMLGVTVRPKCWQKVVDWAFRAIYRILCT
jgi:hypothetical protein